MVFGRFVAWLGPLVLVAVVGCASAPPPVEEPLRADPPDAESTEGIKTSHPELDRAVALIRAGKLEDAQPHLMQTTADDPKHAPGWFYLGVVKDQTGDRAAAEAHFTKALELDPNLVDAAQNLAAVYLDSEPPRPEKAVPVLKKALERSPGDPKLLVNLGVAYGLLKDVPNAEQAYRDALAKEDSSATRFGYGVLLFEAGRPEDAVSHLLKAAEGMNDDAAGLATIARMLGPGKAFSDCVRLLDRAIVLKPKAPELLVRRGVCKHELKNEADASKDFEAAVKLDPAFQPAHYYLGVSLIAQKKSTKGREELRAAIALGKDTPIGRQAAERLAKIK